MLQTRKEFDGIYAKFLRKHQISVPVTNFSTQIGRSCLLEKSYGKKLTATNGGNGYGGADKRIIETQHGFIIRFIVYITLGIYALIVY